MPAPATRSWVTTWVGTYLVIGLAFQLLYFGPPWPLQVGTWLHVLLWPAYVVLGMARRLFIPFAFLALLVLVAVLVFRRARRTDG